MRNVMAMMAFVFCLSCPAQAPRLFHISRSLNKNIVCYDARVSKGKLDLKNPIHVYWHNNEDRPGVEEELNALQRKLAYGYKVKSAGNNEACVTLTAYNKRVLRVCQRNGKWVVLVGINGQECRLQELYVKTKGPMSVEYVELRGVAVANGKHETERIKP